MNQENTANNAPRQLSRSHDVATKVTGIVQARTRLALERYSERVKTSVRAAGRRVEGASAVAVGVVDRRAQYAVDFAQRSILLLGHAAPARQQLPRARAAGSAAGAALRLRNGHGRAPARAPGQLRAAAHRSAEGVTVDAKRRPYVIIDPRGGHGPGIGGFKDDSQVGVALREGHPVYFVIFFPDPEPGQTLLDVCNAEREFVHRVRELHPDAPKPAIVGNCQGGWAAMMLAASSPDDTGPIVIVGAPMSYWGGAWSERRGRQPDALRRRAARRHLARVADVRPRRRQVRRRLAGAELREPEPGQHVLGQVLPACSPTSTPSRRASSSSSAGGAATT